MNSSDCDGPSSSEESKNEAKRKKKKKYFVKYCASWNPVERFKPWLQESTKGIHYVFCSFCRSAISIGSKGLADVV